METETDEELLTMYKETKNPEALEKLLRRHHEKIRAMIVKMVHNEADADDLTQEVFLRAWKGIAGFKNNARFTTWLHTIAVNHVRTFLARRKKHICRTYEQLPETEDMRVNNIDEVVNKEEIRAKLDNALAILTPKLRKALILTTLNELGAGAAARMEACTEATIYWRVHQARKILRKQIAT